MASIGPSQVDHVFTNYLWIKSHIMLCYVAVLANASLSEVLCVNVVIRVRVSCNDLLS